MRHAATIVAVAVFMTPLAIGCNWNPFAAQQPFGSNAMGGSQDAQATQIAELTRRVTQLNADNVELHTEIARHQKDVQRERELRVALQTQLNESATQLSQLQATKGQLDQKLSGLQASTQLRGGATIQANSSLQNSLKIVNIPGVKVKQAGDVIRIELPSDQLFVQGSAQLRQGADRLLDQVASAISRNYARQVVGIEGHTDNSAPTGVGFNGHQLAHAQSMAVFNQFVRSGRLPAQQLFTLSHGANHPQVSNGTLAGRVQNRRIELVIYPETIDRR